MRRGRLIQKMTSLTTAIGVVSVVFAALLNPGQFTAEVNLNDGGVWVTNKSLNLVGHLNYRARALDSAVRTTSSDFDVFQNGETVHFFDAENDTFSPVDVATSSLVDPLSFPDMTLQVGGEVVALTDKTGGRVWTQSLHALTPFAPDDAAPAIVEMPDAITIVGQDGTVHSVSAKTKKIVSLSPGQTPDKAFVRELPDLDDKADLALTAVGKQPIVFDRRASTFYLPNGTKQTLKASSYALQEVGPESKVVILASARGLVRLPLDGGDPILSFEHEAAGNPVRPMIHQGCVYGAWTGSGNFSRECEQSESDAHSVVESLSAAQEARFRVNRDVIVLNDVTSGSLWLPNHNMILIQDWDEVHSQVEENTDSEEDSVDTANETILPERTEENTPPFAENDEFGVRPGRINILPVILNDSDPDGDFLTATPVSQPQDALVSVARYGAALQVRLSEGATGRMSFDYEVNDGRGGVARASVTLIVREANENHAPVQVVVPTVALGTGSSAVFNALANWYDPDGDPFYLDTATAPEGITVRQRETGTLDISESGYGPGKTSIDIAVSDGRDVARGEITVTISGESNVPPIANVDHLIVRQGERVIGRVLDNDTDANGNPLRIVQVSTPPTGITLDWDGIEGTLDIIGDKVGTYYLTYVVSDGPSTSTGVVRIDVIDLSSDLQISLEDDFAVLPEGGYVLVDLLANDSDPSGGILAVQKIDLPAGSPLAVALLNHQVARISAPRALNGPQVFTYTASNGVSTSTATVTVIPRAADTGTEGPELTPDHLVVRVGDVGSVAVLDNDRSPTGLKLTVTPNLEHSIPPDVATVFLSDNIVRVRAGNTPGAGEIRYTVTDNFGTPQTSVIHLVVHGEDDGENTAPKPRDIVVRALAGSTSSIRIPLDGIDPEGDSVTLDGLASSPQLGTATIEGTVIRYEAGAASYGTDTFTYSVRDRLGLAAVGRIRVGIVQRSTLNQSPVALPDIARVRPGTNVAIDVVQNDTDPDGDTLSIIEGSVSSTTADALLPTIRSGRIVLKAPTQESHHTVFYAISDGAGGRAEGVLTLLVTPEAPLLAPIARDDSVTVEQVQASEDGTVTLSVLANDEDPDGIIEETILTSNDSNLRVNNDGTVTVRLTEEEQILLYTITDTYQLSASATVRVPGRRFERPTLDTRPRTLQVKAGETLEISINDYVVTREGRSVRLTSEDKVRAGIGANGDRLVKSPTTLAFTSLPDFSGPTSISFEVTDGLDLNDSEGATAFINLPILVTAAENRPPTIRPIMIDVGAGEDPVTIDLAPTVTDPDGDNPAALTYSLGDVPAGITAQLSGSLLTVGTGIDQQKGSAGAIAITVADEKGAAVTGHFPVSVLATSKPPLQASPAYLNLEAGASAQVNIADYVPNPLPEKGALHLVGDPQVTEGGVASASGLTISVQAKLGFTGTFVVTYRVGDATKDPSRETTGTITVSVRDVPEAPQNLQVVPDSPYSARISWRAGDPRGSQIIGFTVTDHTQGDSQDCGLVTTCVMEGRRTGVEHTFSVTARNAVGESEASNRVSVMLNVVPDAPAQPTLSLGDNEVTVTWKAPRNEGSPIRSYTVALSPHSSQTVQAIPGQEIQSFVFKGVQNGVSYTATVTASNDQGTSAPSPASVAVTPYGRPFPVVNLQATYANLGAAAPGDRPVVLVSWQAPENNGRAIEYYTVSSGDIVKRVFPPQTSTILEFPNFPTDQVTFTVTATNNGARPDVYTSIPESVSTWVFGQPASPTITGVWATGEDHEISIQWQPSAGGQGWQPSDLRYEWSMGEEWAPLTGHILSHPEWANGTPKRVSIRAVGMKNGQQVTSQAALSAEVSPYGPPGPPSISCSGGERKVICTWHAAQENGRPGRYHLKDPNAHEVEAQGIYEYVVEPSTTVRACIEFTQNESGRKVEDCAVATSDAPPPPPNPDPPGDDDNPPENDGNLVFTLKMQGLRGELRYTGTNLPKGSYKIYCWNAPKESDINWGDSPENPGNFLGTVHYPGSEEVPIVFFFKGLGGTTFDCPGNKFNPQMMPNENFSIQLVSVNDYPNIWIH